MSPWMVYFYEKNVNKHGKSILCIVSPTVQTKKSPGPKRHLGQPKNSWRAWAWGLWCFYWGSKLGWFEIWRSRYHVSHQVRIQLPGGYEPWGWMVVDTWVDLCVFWWLCLRFWSLTLMTYEVFCFSKNGRDVTWGGREGWRLWKSKCWDFWAKSFSRLSIFGWCIWRVHDFVYTKLSHTVDGSEILLNQLRLVV